MNSTRLHWRLVDTVSGNGLVPSDYKLLPEPMLTQTAVAIWWHYAQWVKMQCMQSTETRQPFRPKFICEYVYIWNWYYGLCNLDKQYFGFITWTWYKTYLGREQICEYWSIYQFLINIAMHIWIHSRQKAPIVGLPTNSVRRINRLCYVALSTYGNVSDIRLGFL